MSIILGKTRLPDNSDFCNEIVENIRDFFKPRFLQDQIALSLLSIIHEYIPTLATVVHTNVQSYKRQNFGLVVALIQEVAYERDRNPALMLFSTTFQSHQVNGIVMTTGSRQLNTIYSQNWNNMICRTTKSTKWHVRPAKTQISMGIHPVWSESSLCAK